MLSFRLLRHYLLSRRSGALIRSVAWMAMTGIIIGVAALIIVVSVMNGFNRVIRERHLNAEPHLVVHYTGSTFQRDWLDQTKKQIQDTLGSGVDEMSPFSSQDVVLKTVDGYFSGAIAKGLESESIHRLIRRLDERQEDMPSEEQTWDLSQDEVMMGSELADGLSLVPGDKVVLIAPEALLLPEDEAPPIHTVTVKGFFYSQLQDVDGRLILYNQKQPLSGLKNTASQSMGVEVRLKDGGAYETARAQLKAHGLQVETWPERNSAMFFALKMEKIAMTVFLALSALITSFSIVTVLILLVTQKRKEIGMLMAMGLNRRQTQRTFTWVGVWLSMIGVLAGAVLGVVICYVIARYPMNILPNIYYDRTIPADVDPQMVFFILLSALAISFLGSYFPAWMSAAAAPADALRGRVQGGQA